MKASHSKGQMGFIPLPARSRAAVVQAARVAARMGCFSTKAIEVSPETALVKLAELFFGLVDAAAQIEDDEAVGEGAKFEGDFDGVVGAEFSGAHGVFENVYGGVEGGGAAGFEVAGVDAGALARNEEHELVEVGGIQRGVEEDFADLQEAVLDVALEVDGLELGGEVLEAGIGDGVEEAGAVGEVAIDGHGGNADFFCDGAHGDGGEAFAVEEIACGCEDRSGGGWLGWGGFG